METVGRREKPLPGDDWGSTVGRPNEVEADLPGPAPFLRISAPNDAVDSGGTPAAAFGKGRVMWLKTDLKEKWNEVQFSAGLVTD